MSSSPDKPNISYSVRVKASIEDVFTPLDKLRAARCRLPRVIIYCRRCEECAELYHFFHSSLKQEFTEPVGAPNLAMFCLVDIYTGVTRKSIRDSIVTSFGTSHAPLHVVIYHSIWYGHRLCRCTPGHPLGTFIGHRIICSGVWSSWLKWFPI